MTTQDRIDFVRFFEEVERQNFHVDISTVAPRFKKWLPEGDNNSISLIAFWEAMLNNAHQDIAVKMFYDFTDTRFSEDTEFLSLMYEILVYRYITQRIIATREAPNFIAYVAHIHLDANTLSEFSGDQERVNAYKTKVLEYIRLPPEYLREKILLGIVTQVPPNVISLREWFEDLRQRIPSVEDRRAVYLPVLFQIVYALCVLDRRRIMHNDLHPKNVLISQLNRNVRLKYEVNGQRYTIITSNIVYIFDWGNAWIEELGTNPTLDGFKCDIINMCNEFRRGYDMFLVLCSLNFEGAEFLINKHIVFRDGDYNRNRTKLIQTESGDFLAEKLFLDPESKDDWETFFEQRVQRYGNESFHILTRDYLQVFLLPDSFEKVRDVQSGVFLVFAEEGFIVAYGFYQCRLNYVSGRINSPWDFFNRRRVFGEYRDRTMTIPSWKISENDADDPPRAPQRVEDFEEIVQVQPEESGDNEEKVQPEEQVQAEESGDNEERVIRTPSPPSIRRPDRTPPRHPDGREEESDEEVLPYATPPSVRESDTRSDPED